MLKVTTYLLILLSIGFGQYLLPDPKGQNDVRLAPKLMNYQGFMTDTMNNPINDSLDILFRIYDAASAGNVIWSETQMEVPILKGIFHVLLGTVTPIPDSVFTKGTDRWLELRISSQNLTPRTRFTAAPYAYTADYADTATYARNAGYDNDWTRATGKVYTYNLTDTVGIRTSAPRYALDVNGVICGGTIDTVLAVYGAVLGGYSNLAGDAAGDTGAVVAGGYNNAATGKHSYVGGGYFNAASGDYSTVGGGYCDTASFNGTTVAGGWHNVAVTNMYSTVGGGVGNRVSGYSGIVAGGYYNTVSGGFSTIAGGAQNYNAASYSAILGGTADSIASSGNYSYLFGINSNLTQDSTFMVDLPHVRFGKEAGGYEFPTIDGSSGQVMVTNGAGQLTWGSSVDNDWIRSGGKVYTYNLTDSVGIRTALPRYALDVNGVICGGVNDTASGGYSFIGGGQNNRADTIYTTISGGYSNIAYGLASIVAGGYDNTAGNTNTDTSCVIGGGGYNIADGYYATVGGGRKNLAWGNKTTICGGDSNRIEGYNYGTIAGGLRNRITDTYGSIGGGFNNQATGTLATIGGGDSNIGRGAASTVGGGRFNENYAYRGTIAGGYSNEIDSTANYASIGGGYMNTNWGYAGTIPGGYLNVVARGWPDSSAAYSFAAGYRAKSYNSGCFTWGDNTNSDINNWVQNRWIARCSGGVYFYTNGTLTSGVYVAAGGSSWSSVSDRNLKDNFKPVNGREVLDKLAQMPITTWNYKSQDPSIRHIGPMAQDFAAFGVGEDDKHITTIDADGIALVAIQELYKQNQELKQEIEALKQELKNR